MSLDLALNTLKSLGLTETEAKVYIYLAKKGPRNNKNIACFLGLSEHQTLLCLDRLVAKKMVNTAPEYSIKYLAAPLTFILDLLTETNTKEAEQMIKNKKNLLCAWQSMMSKEQKN
jgi:sugar-specific transcriptional regulator TrmB